MLFHPDGNARPPEIIPLLGVPTFVCSPATRKCRLRDALSATTKERLWCVTGVRRWAHEATLQWCDGPIGAGRAVYAGGARRAGPGRRRLRRLVGRPRAQRAGPAATAGPVYARRSARP